MEQERTMVIARYRELKAERQRAGDRDGNWACKIDNFNLAYPSVILFRLNRECIFADYLKAFTMYRTLSFSTQLYEESWHIPIIKAAWAHATDCILHGFQPFSLQKRDFIYLDKERTSCDGQGVATSVGLEYLKW